jgi:hypothetical protein
VSVSVSIVNRTALLRHVVAVLEGCRPLVLLRCDGSPSRRGGAAAGRVRLLVSGAGNTDRSQRRAAVP